MVSLMLFQVEFRGCKTCNKTFSPVGKLEGHMAKVPDAIEAYLDNFMSSKPRINSMHLSKLNSLKQPNNRLVD